MCNVAAQNKTPDWSELSVKLGGDRTPFQILVHYQRDLNPNLERSEWTDEEAERLKEIVAQYGNVDWRLVSTFIPGHTPAQCSAKWSRALSAAAHGRFSHDEDKRLMGKIHMMMDLTGTITFIELAGQYGTKMWSFIASFMDGRTNAQCRERYEILSQGRGEWTREELEALWELRETHGAGNWAKIARELNQAFNNKRTDKVCADLFGKSDVGKRLARSKETFVNEV